MLIDVVHSFFAIVRGRPLHGSFEHTPQQRDVSKCLDGVDREDGRGACPPLRRRQIDIDGK
jgi:hypothetical protein